MAIWSRDMVFSGTDEILLKTVNPGQISGTEPLESKMVIGHRVAALPLCRVCQSH